MAYLADTNILLRSSEPAHPMYPQAVAAVEALLHRGEAVCIVAQNVIEFWSVATRPAERNGLGLTHVQADQEATRLETLLTLLPETPVIYTHWRRLVMAHAVSGVQVHDARLVAAMLTHGLTHVLTFNVDDFRRYSDIITPVHPQDVAGA
jgi:predicted nucleic acid-binding protein